MDLWNILVLGVVRLGLDCDYDRLEDLANHHGLIRQILGLNPVRSEYEKPFHYKTLSDNVCHVDEELLEQINGMVAQAGRGVFKKNGGADPIQAKADTYVLETNVHFPTDLNLLWDSQRKCLELLAELCARHAIGGWRKAADWARRLKGQMRRCSKISHGGGRNKAQRLEEATKDYLKQSMQLERKVEHALGELSSRSLSVGEIGEWVEVDYFHQMMKKFNDLVERRLVKGEKIPHEEKIYSLFEPHTQWINKGKFRPEVELGHKLLITTEEHGLILDYKVLEQLNDAEEVLPLADRLFERYGEGSIASLSVDKGFSRQEDRELLAHYIPQVIMPKKGRRNGEERQRETHRKFQQLRRAHQAIESGINCLEHHGLNRCPDKGLSGYKRYVGYGVLAYNLHKIGRQILQGRRARVGRDKVLKAAA